MAKKRIFTYLLGAIIISAPFLSSAHAIAGSDQTYIEIAKPPKGSLILSSSPEVSLTEFTAAGTQDPKIDWSNSAKKYIAAATNRYLNEKGYEVSQVDFSTSDNPRAVQILKLNDAVNDAILLNYEVGMKLPSKPTFDWTLGEGVKTLNNVTGSKTPKYALFLTAKGSYSSGGRKALMVGALLVGGAVQMGGQAIQASLVDLETGKVVWFKFHKVSALNDIRTEEGANAEIAALCKELPI